MRQLRCSRSLGGIAHPLSWFPRSFLTGGQDRFLQEGVRYQSRYSVKSSSYNEFLCEARHSSAGLKEFAAREVIRNSGCDTVRAMDEPRIRSGSFLAKICKILQKMKKGDI
jgi:hypothetical protein